jgi:hypothetical protein
LKSLTFILFTLLLFSCAKRAQISNTSQVVELQTPYIIDISPKTETYYKASEMKYAVNKFMYLGALTDTIIFKPFQDYNHLNYLDKFESIRNNVVKEGFSIFISTKQELSLELNYQSNHSYFSSINEKEINKSNLLVQAIPVIIQNTSKNMVYLHLHSESAIFIQEAKDEKGNWKPIEYYTFSYCGNSESAIGIQPNSIAVYKILKYDGEFETDLRLKFKNDKHIIYSNIYKGRINKNQFKIPEHVKRNKDVRRHYRNNFYKRSLLNK